MGSNPKRYYPSKEREAWDKTDECELDQKPVVDHEWIDLNDYGTVVQCDKNAIEG